MHTHMNIGDILFVYGKRGRLISRLICLFTRSPFSHVAQVIGFTSDGVAIIAEDLYNGSIIHANSYTKNAYELRTWKKSLTKKEKDILINYHYKTGGMYYAYHQLFIIAAHILLRMGRRRKMQRIDIADPSICSEKIHETSILLGRDLRPDLNPGLVTPQDLYESRLLE